MLLRNEAVQEDRAGEEASDDAAASGDRVAVSQRELEISWETNNLFDYLKGLQQAGEGRQEMDRCGGERRGGGGSERAAHAWLFLVASKRYRARCT
jgi:hypothetical protein